MKKLINANLSGKILLSAFILMLILHVLILMQVLPSTIVWGNQIKPDQSNLLSLELVAIVVTIIFAGIVTVKMRSLKSGTTSKLINLSMWIVFAYLVFNIIGNFSSGVRMETLFFGPLTILMAFCTLRLAIEK